MKAPWIQAAKVFLTESRDFTTARPEKEPLPQALVAHRAYIQKVDSRLQEIGWTLVEYQKFVPNKEDQEVFENLLTEIFDEVDLVN